MESNKDMCPLCHDRVDKLVYRFHYDSEKIVLEKIELNYPGWAVKDGICSRCIDYYQSEIVIEQRILPEIGPYFPIKTMDDFIVIPTGLRVDADPRYTGKGVTICFIDSGFCMHPDLTVTRNRIKKIIDITKPPKTIQSDNGESLGSDRASWHGTMTTVVCAGDGYLSNGLYKGIASEAELVLIKVQNKESHIPTENIVNALQWILLNYKEYDIRIVNMSLGDDLALSYKESEIDKLAEQLIEKGVIIVAAVGNDINGTIKPPANALNVIAVGGIDDENKLNEPVSKLYHSSFGKTADELMKPELVSPAIWIAAPVLPGTKEQEESEALHYLLKVDNINLQREFLKLADKTEFFYSLTQSNDVTYIREMMLQRITACKYISPHYMHVDGTSFAAPIVSSVIAQLLEINPTLTPAMIRELLFSTAHRIENVPAERQGFGILQPRRAIMKALKRETNMKTVASPHINQKLNTIAFYIQNECASQISLAGTFNHWAQDVLLMEPVKNGLWKIEIPMLPPGRYHYKFLIDNKTWVEDFNNPFREPDGFSGFNNVLFIENKAYA